MTKAAYSVHLRDPKTNRRTVIRKGQTIPSWAEDLITNPLVLSADTDADTDDPLGSVNKDVLLATAEDWEIEGVSGRSKKGEIIAALREAGYEGDGSDLTDDGNE